MTMDEAHGYHAPVLVEEVLALLQAEGEKLVLDATVGGGGHALAILEGCAKCRLLAVDRDPEALEQARRALAAHRDRVRFIHARFDDATLDPEVRDRGLDGVLLDLGVSSHQLDADSRGFAFRRGVPLDMRMDAAAAGGAPAFLRESSEDRLVEVFREYGEERHARRLAREVVKRRETEAFETSDQLVAAMAVTYDRPPSARDKARIFQAVRIAVNDELAALERALPAFREVLNEGGVIVVIAYHSLEDRIVKNAFREWSRSCVCPPEIPVCMCRGEALGEMLTRKPVRPSEEETERNPRARSARLRAWRKAA